MSIVAECEEKGQRYFPPGFLESVEIIWTERKAGVKYTIGEMERGEDGPAWLRSQLPSEFRDVSLRMMRDAMARLNKSARAGKTSRTNTEPTYTIESLAAKLVKRFPPADQHSEEYQIRTSDLDKRVARHKQDCGFRCQLCGRIRMGELLEVHHVSYDRYGGNELITDLLCVCKTPCHKYADGLRRWGNAQDAGIDTSIDLFSEIEE